MQPHHRAPVPLLPTADDRDRRSSRGHSDHRRSGSSAEDSEAAREAALAAEFDRQRHRERQAADEAARRQDRELARRQDQQERHERLVWWCPWWCVLACECWVMTLCVFCVCVVLAAHAGSGWLCRLIVSAVLCVVACEQCRTVRLLGQ